MTLRKIPYRPGVVKDDPALTAEGYAQDSQWIRWVRGDCESMGGWTLLQAGLSGNARDILVYSPDEGDDIIAVGTTTRLYAYTPNASPVLKNITPVGASGTFSNNPFATVNLSATITVTLADHGLTAGTRVMIANSATFNGVTPGGPSGTYGANPFTTQSGSKTITVSAPGHTMNAGDAVTIAGSAAVGGITPSGFYMLLSVSTNQYEIQHSTAASSTATGGGAGATYAYSRAYDVVTTPTSNTYTITHIAAATGTGSGGGASATYRNDVVSFEDWALANKGGRLLACAVGGAIYSWDDLSQVAAALTNAPTENRWMTVTAEGAVMAWGTQVAGGTTFNDMLVRWSDLDDITVWTPSSTNNAGSFTLGVGSKAVTARNTKSGALAWTDNALMFVRYTAEFEAQYQFELLGVGCGASAPHSPIEHNGISWWISNTGGFFVYSGGAPRTLPNPCQQWFRDNCKLDNTVWYGAFDVNFNAVMWFFPQILVSNENNLMIRLDISESLGDPKAGWSTHAIERNVWFDRGLQLNPFAVDGDGNIWIQEYENSANGSAISRYIDWAPIDLSSAELGDGAHVMNVRRFVVDRKFGSGSTPSFTVTLSAKRWPLATAVTQTYTMAATTQYNDARLQGRQIGMKLETSGTNDSWRLGDIRMDLSEGSLR